MIREHYAHLIAAKERVMLERAAGAFKLTLVPNGKHARRNDGDAEAA